MKLKKIASLMLAGVMAVSMLAGCSGNGSNNNNNNDEDPVVNTGMAGKVIAALDKDTTDKVAFTASSSLETTLQKAVQNVGTDISNSKMAANILDALLKVDTDLTSKAIPQATSNSKATDKEEQSVTTVTVLDKANIGSDENYASKALAAAVEGFKADGVHTLAKLEADSVIYTDNDGKNYWYNFTYTGDMAVIEVTDSVTGQSTYVVAYTITRTPAEQYQ